MQLLSIFFNAFIKFQLMQPIFNTSNQTPHNHFSIPSLLIRGQYGTLLLLCILDFFRDKAWLSVQKEKCRVIPLLLGSSDGNPSGFKRSH